VTANPGRQTLAYLAFGIAYYLLAVYAASLPFQSRLPYFIWPAHGLALGALLVAPPRRWPVYLGLAFVASLLVGTQLFAPWQRVAMMLAVNVVLPFFVAGGLLRLAGPEVRLDSIRGVASFLVGMAPLAATTAVVEGLFSNVGFYAPLRDQWSVTFLSDMVGMLIVAPLVIAWSRGAWREEIVVARPRMPELVVLYAGLILTAHYIFATQPETTGIIPPLAYLCAPVLIWAALRFGLREATLGLAIFGLITYWHTTRSLGRLAPDSAQILLLLHVQAYLAVIVVTTLFAAALLSERRAAVGETEAWRRRHEAVIRASGNLLYDMNPVSGTILWDGDTRAVLGIPEEEISTLRKWMARVHPDDRMRLKGLRGLFAQHELAHISLEYRFRRADDQYTTLGVNGYLVDSASGDEAGPRVIGFVKDVSDKIRADEDRRRLEAQLKQAEKMEAVGHLAGGIAHDFNNILGAILGYGELAQKRAQGGDMQRYLDTIMSAGNRAKALVTQILSYSRAEGSERIPVIVVPIVQEACDLVHGSSPQAIDLRFTANDQDLAVRGDPTRLHQLFMNLLTNAVQAMGQGGTLEVTVDAVFLVEPRKVRSGEVPPGDYVRVCVKDTGHGIAPEVIDRIFEPFFTTKPAGRGTGLGLALVHAAVKEHNGFIDVVSELGLGTEFTIWLPRTQAEESVAPPAEPEPKGRGELILAVDDEPEVLAALEEMLASMGYEPAGFGDSRAALEAVRAEPQRFDAVVTDEVMPQLTGTQLAVGLREVNPSIPIVIASGYGGAGFETRALSAGVNRVLRKPYRMAELSEALASVLPAK
jgi:signal transduction histidine kinase/ActR/RegA family two-component response regulator